MANGLRRGARANGLFANGLRRSARLANGLLSSAGFVAAVELVRSLF